MVYVIQESSEILRHSKIKRYINIRRFKKQNHRRYTNQMANTLAQSEYKIKKKKTQSLAGQIFLRIEEKR